MTHAEHACRQEDLLQRVVQILIPDPRVLGIYFSGSLARGTQDAFSDLDVGCYLRDEAKTGRTELYEAVGRIAPTLCQMWLYDRHALILFESGVRLDLDFLPPSALEREPVPADYEVVYDPDGVLDLAAKGGDEESTQTPREPPVWPESQGSYLDWYLWMFRQAYAWAKRGAQGDHRSFEKLSGAVGSLQQIRSGLIEMHLWVHGAQNYLELVDPSMAHRLAATYPHLDADEICRALRLLLDEYARVGEAYAGRIGATSPEEKVDKLRVIFDELDRLE